MSVRSRVRGTVSVGGTVWEVGKAHTSLAVEDEEEEVKVRVGVSIGVRGGRPGLGARVRGQG